MIKVITEGYPDNSKEEVMLDSITCTYIQEPDCTEDRDGDPQEIILSSRDGGGGKFINISTKSWSIDDSNDFEDLKILLNDFKIRANEVFDNSRYSRKEVLEENNRK